MMNQRQKIGQSIQRVALVSVIGAAVPFCASCGSAPDHSPEIPKRVEAQIHAARSAFHQDQEARDYASRVIPEPKAPANEVRYYRVPVEAHVNEDGLLIEAHKLTLELIQP